MKTKALLALTVPFFIAACGSDSSSGGSKTGSLTVKLTDAPVDGAANVFVTVGGVSLNFNDAGWVDHNFDTPQKVDLLTLQGGETLTLFPQADVLAGSYQVRLNLHDDGDAATNEHYLVENDSSAEQPLTIPSGSQTGLKLSSSIVVPANGSADYTIDFDVRRSVVLRGNAQNNNGYSLKPVLRLIDNTVADSISGVITDTDPSLFTTDCSDDDPLTHNVVYVYEGTGVTPDDYGSAGTEAVTTAPVQYNETSGEYSYVTAPLLAGEYTVALTCNADAEDVEADDELSFKAISTVTVTAGASDTEADDEDDEVEAEGDEAEEENDAVEERPAAEAVAQN